MVQPAVAPPDKPRPVYPRDYRCPNCGRLQFSAVLAVGSRVDVRCAKCGRLHRYTRAPEGLVVAEGSELAVDSNIEQAV